MCKLKEIGGKDSFFLLQIIFFFCDFGFFLSRPLCSTATSFLSLHNQHTSATFSKPAPYPQSANFYCVLWWTARWPFKKDYSVVLFFLAAILIFVFFSIGLSLCFTRSASSIAFTDRFVRWARNLKTLKKKSRVEKKSQSKSMRSRKLIPLSGHCWMDWSNRKNISVLKSKWIYGQLRPPLSYNLEKMIHFSLCMILI